MQISDKRSIVRVILILASFLIVVAIIWNTYNFFQIFKEDERSKVELWADAQLTLNNASENTDVELPFKIISSNTSIPIILTNSRDSIMKTANLPVEIEADTLRRRIFFNSLKKQNNPIQVGLADNNFQYLYYGNSPLLNKLKYYPIALVLIIVLFGAVVYIFFRATKMGAQNRLWAGMAKETAHQIGTPLSSLLGWIEIMKVDNVDETTVTEVEKDVNRLQTIAERFSKIGSKPELEELDIVQETAKSFEYLKSRASKQVAFSFSAPDYAVPVMFNPELHSWTIENLVKNAIDAMKGKGKLDITIEDTDKYLKIKVSDSGKGIAKGQYRKVFEPGFTTKKRGWGLGLSLTKRIVEEYHKGRIKVLTSEVGKGTTMQASFPKK